MERLFLKGLPVSNGVGIGEFYIFEPKDCEINLGTVDRRAVKNEISRLNAGLENTLNEYRDLRGNLGKRLEKQGDLIFDVYEAILKDSVFVGEIASLITSKRLFAENAIYICINRYIREMEENGGEYARQRVYDLEDIRTRIIRNLTDAKEVALDRIYHKQVVAVRELTPSLAAALGKKKVMGIVAYAGAAYFAHSAIILRSLGIPVLNNINFDFVRRFGRQPVVIDGTNGFLIINPDKADVDRYRVILKNNIKRQKELLGKRFKPAYTKDGCRINLLANIGTAEECDDAREKNADGIGLIRTEVLFAAGGRMPDEREQYLMYSRIVKKMGNKPVVIRTADVGEEKVLGYMGIGARAPGQLQRGLKNSLSEMESFMTQIRAILCSAELGNVSITFPMVNSAEEIREAREFIKRAQKQLEDEGGKSIRGISAGAVIETKQGLNSLDEILAEVDFISIGTNDLLQQVMGKDRKHSRVLNEEYFNPVFLKTLKNCIDKANNAGKPVSICGEMASDPEAAILLVGLGINNLSMGPSKILDVKNVLRRLSLNEIRQLAASSLECSGIKEVKRVLSKKLGRF